MRPPSHAAVQNIDIWIAPIIAANRKNAPNKSASPIRICPKITSGSMMLA